MISMQRLPRTTLFKLICRVYTVNSFSKHRRGTTRACMELPGLYGKNRLSLSKSNFLRPGLYELVINNVLYCIVLWFGIVLYHIVLYCGVVWHRIVLYCIVLWCGIVLYCIVLYCIVLWCGVPLNCIVLYCGVALYCIAL